MLHGVEVNGLYQFTTISLVGDASPTPVSALTAVQSEVASSSSTNILVEFDRWHQRLGYLSTTIVNQVLVSCNASVPKNKTTNLCSACMLGKSHKLPFLASLTQSTAPLELVFADLWGLAPCYSAGY